MIDSSNLFIKEAKDVIRDMSFNSPSVVLLAPQNDTFLSYIDSVSDYGQQTNLEELVKYHLLIDLGDFFSFVDDSLQGTNTDLASASLTIPSMLPSTQSLSMQSIIVTINGSNNKTLQFQGGQT